MNPDSRNNLLDITFVLQGKEDRYGVSKEFTEVLVGRDPKTVYNDKKGTNPSIANPHFIELKEPENYQEISKLQFALIRKESVWHIINLSKSNEIKGADKKEIKKWDLNSTKDTFDGVKEIDEKGENIFTIGSVTVKIKINTAVGNALNISEKSSNPAAAAVAGAPVTAAATPVAGAPVTAAATPAAATPAAAAPAAAAPAAGAATAATPAAGAATAAAPAAAASAGQHVTFANKPSEAPAGNAAKSSFGDNRVKAATKAKHTGGRARSAKLKVKSRTTAKKRI